MGGKRTTWIKCKNTSVRGIIGFYLDTCGTEYFLCTQKFRKGTWAFYQNGVPYKIAIDYSKAHYDHAILNVMKRIRSSILYLQKNENIYIPERKNKKKMKLYLLYGH